MEAHAATSKVAHGRQGPKRLFCCKMTEVKLATFAWLHYTNNGSIKSSVAQFLICH